MTLAEYVAKADRKPFSPGARWHRVPGCSFVTAFWSGVPAFAEAAAPDVTVYRCCKTNEIVGVRVWDSQRLIKPRRRGVRERLAAAAWGFRRMFAMETP